MLGRGGLRLVVRGRGSCNRGAAQLLRQKQRRTLLTQSYAKGPTEPPLLTQTIPQHFSSIVSKHGDRAAVISSSQGDEGRLTYRGLDQRSNVLARSLQERGVRKGDRVAVSLGNCWEFAAATYALFKLGAILVPLNPAFNSLQVISALSHLEAAHLIIGAETNVAYKPPRENVTLLKAIAADLTLPDVQSESVPSLRNIILVDNAAGRIDTSPFSAATPFTSLMNESSGVQDIIPDSELHKDDIVNIQFTSGTTTLPKAACLTHHSILNNGFSIGSRMSLLPTDIICCPPPLFHCFGCILGYMATATHGSAILFPTPAFSPLATLTAIRTERATGLYGVPTMFSAELELLANGTVPRTGFENLRTGIAAGSPVPSHLMSRLHEELNLTGLTNCYGMTETSPVSCMTTPTDPLPKRLLTVGRPLPHVTAKIVSITDRTAILPIGQRGELVVSGYLVFRGYWADPARTAEVRVVDEQGRVWMHTGDEAVMDGEGYVTITGRIKDLVIRGGENIHPLEIENALFAHPGVSGVSVVGLPDERYGEVVAAFVVPHQDVSVGEDDKVAEGEQGGYLADSKSARSGVHAREGDAEVLTKGEVREWVRTQLSSHLVPRYVFWVEDFPKTASGKIQKFKLREMGIRLLKRGSEVK